jgi:transcriptional regulator
MRTRDKLPILRGTLDVLILRSIAAKPLHGFEISLWLEEGSEGTFDLDDSALYQALHRLEARKLVQGEWGTTENNRRARYYRITPSGRSHLEDESRRLVSFAKTLSTLLAPARGK